VKIAHVVCYFQPRIGYQEFYLAKEQQKMGHDVCVVTSDRYAPLPDFSGTMGKILGQRYVGHGVFDEEGLRVVRLPMLLEFASDNALLGLKSALADFSPDVVHAHGVSAPTTLLTIICKVFLHYKVVVDCHMDYSLESKSKVRRTIFYLLSRNPVCRWILSKADGYIAVAQSAKLWLSREWGIPDDKIQVIPLGADTAVFFPSSVKREMMRKRLGVGKRDILIVYAGKLVPEKDIEILLWASALLSQAHRNTKLLIIGDGPREYVDELRQVISRCKMRQNVFFHPFQHRTVLPDYYNAGDIGVWPGMPSITIVEAMATGLPIIIPRGNDSLSPGLHHYIEYRNGLEFRRGNIGELAEHLKTLVVDENLRRTMAMRSRQLVKEKLDWTAITLETLDYYAYALNRQPFAA
jgi:glycosyltransferase involved in cell wall biosynthesis